MSGVMGVSIEMLVVLIIAVNSTFTKPTLMLSLSNCNCKSVLEAVLLDSAIVLFVDQRKSNKSLMLLTMLSFPLSISADFAFD